jgi:hypothetical protein
MCRGFLIRAWRRQGSVGKGGSRWRFARSENRRLTPCAQNECLSGRVSPTGSECHRRPTCSGTSSSGRPAATPKEELRLAWEAHGHNWRNDGVGRGWRCWGHWHFDLGDDPREHDDRPVRLAELGLLTDSERATIAETPSAAAPSSPRAGRSTTARSAAPSGRSTCTKPQSEHWSAHERVHALTADSPRPRSRPRLLRPRVQYRVEHTARCSRRGGVFPDAAPGYTGSGAGSHPPLPIFLNSVTAAEAFRDCFSESGRSPDRSREGSLRKCRFSSL